MSKFGAAKPVELARVEADAGKLHNSSIGDVPRYHPDDGSVTRRYIEEVIGRNNMTDPRHILHNNVWRTRNMATHVARNQSGPEIIFLPCRRSDYEADLL